MSVVDKAISIVSVCAEAYVCTVAGTTELSVFWPHGTSIHLQTIKNAKLFHTRYRATLPLPGADASEQAVSLQVKTKSSIQR